MTNIALPPGIFMPPALQPKDAPAQEDTAEQKAAQLPQPAGYKLLCLVPDVAENYENSSLIRPDQVRKQEEHGTAVLFVMKVGPDAYKDEKKFPSGPWCAEGDFVLVRTYSGTRFKIYGKEFRMLNDDQIEGVVQDPRGITRAF